MRRDIALFAFAAALTFGAAPAMAGVMPDFNPVMSDHVREARFSETQPQRYPTTWGDEAAQSLGVKDGKWEAFKSTPSSSFEPSLGAGVDSGGAMLRLQWQ